MPGVADAVIKNIEKAREKSDFYRPVSEEKDQYNKSTELVKQEG
jgi:hypothetical protein